MDYTALTDIELQAHLRAIEIVLEARKVARPIIPIVLKVLLIVDDDFQILGLLEQTFNIGYQVITATSAPIALKAAAAKPPHIALIDWELNDNKTGCELSWRLIELYPKLPIIILSGYDIPQEDAVNCGARLAVKKPWSPKELGETIRGLLEGD